MKSIFIVVLICTRICLYGQGFSISSPTVIPQAPTSGDFVKIATSLTLSSLQWEIGSPTFTVSHSPNKISLEVCYFVDVWLGNNYKVDTFNIGSLSAGIYTVSFQPHFSNNDSICNPISGGSISYTLLVDNPTAMDELSYSDEMNLFPNPVQDHFTLSLSNRSLQILNLSLTNTLGETVYALKNITSTEKIPIANLSPGIYFVHVQTGRGTKTLKILKIEPN